MKEFYDVLKKCVLFKNVPIEKFDEVLSGARATAKRFGRNEVISVTGKEITDTAIIVKGDAYISKTDNEGNVNLIMEIGAGGSFGEVLSFAKIRRSPVTIAAGINGCTAIFIPTRNIIATCTNAPDSCRATLIENLTQFLAEKSMRLHVKNDILAQKTIRQRLMSYFYYNMIESGSPVVDVTFSREGLADFLCVNNAALSRELGKMRDEGIITFFKNHFVITNADFLCD